MKLAAELPAEPAWLNAPPRLDSVAARQSQERLSSPEVAALAEKYQSGSTVYELAKEFGINRKTVSDYLHRANVPMRLAGLSPEQVDEAVTLYKSGWSLSKIDQRLGFSESTVLRQLRARGIPIRDTHGRER